MTGAGPPIALIGFMGTGKSTVGSLLAAELGYEFQDLDELIASEAGSSIPEIFFREGEAGFRRRERDLLRRVYGGPGLVLATGGGVVLEQGNIDILRAAGPVVALTADLAAILSRAGQDGSRPLLATADPAAAAARLLSQRADLYRAAADLIVDTTDLSPADAAARIASWYRRWRERE